jgi:queuine tRNA-ribosyltransferase
MRFELIQENDGARCGRLTFERGTVETPAFMPVGTYGSVKAVTPEELEALGAEIVLGNTFHLMLRPGVDIVAAHGGLHGFMHWERPILTDSGGFQVFSLARLRKLSEQGVTFRSPVDGDEILLTPERSIEVQHGLDSDVVMSFDECTAYPATHTQAESSMELSLRWAQRGRSAFDALKDTESDAALFGIVQGGVYPDRSRRDRRRTARGARRPRTAAAAGRAALSDGRRHALGSGEGRRPRHGHVRLRDPDPACAQRPAFHE